MNRKKVGCRNLKSAEVCVCLCAFVCVCVRIVLSWLSFVTLLCLVVSRFVLPCESSTLFTVLQTRPKRRNTSRWGKRNIFLLLFPCLFPGNLDDVTTNTSDEILTSTYASCCFRTFSFSICFRLAVTLRFRFGQFVTTIPFGNLTETQPLVPDCSSALLPFPQFVLVLPEPVGPLADNLSTMTELVLFFCFHH